MFEAESMQTALQRRNRKRMKRRRVVMRAALDQANAARGVYLRALEEGKSHEEAIALHDAFVASLAEADNHEAEPVEGAAEEASAPIEEAPFAEEAPAVEPVPDVVVEPVEAKKKPAKAAKGKKGKDEAPASSPVVAPVVAAPVEPVAPAPLAKPEDHPDLAWLKDDEDDIGE